jgi:hypothetical protein
MIRTEQYSTLAEYIRMGWECANPDVVRNGLDELCGTEFHNCAVDARTLFDAFLATDKTKTRLLKLREDRAKTALAKLGVLLESAEAR